MKNKGYAFSLVVFLLFVPVLLMAVTNIKSASIDQESAYESLSMMKAARAAHYLEAYKVAYYSPSSGTCDGFASNMDDFIQQIPLKITIDCGAPPTAKVSSYGNYTYSFNI